MQLNSRPPQRTPQRWAATAFAALFGVILFAAFLLGREVFDDLERQRTASSDNVQWTLTQVEVEYLAYLNELEHLLRFGETEQAQTISQVRKQFDVFYSRVDTLAASPLFAELRSRAEYSQPLQTVLQHLNSAIPTIDGTGLTDLSTAKALLDRAETLQPDVRALSLSGLSYFANLSDARRDDTSRTLIRLAAIAGALVLMLAAIAGYLTYINRKMHQRGHALAQANSRVQTVMSTSLDAVVVVNSDGKVLEFNPSAEQMFQRPRAEALGKSIGELIVPDHLRDAHSAGMERMKAGGDRHVVGKGRVQLEAMRANGEVFPVELALQSAFNGTEEIIIGFIRDISKRVAAQQELISARDEAMAGERAKDRFLTVMSHEIRTPLNGLLGNLSLLTNSDLTRDQQPLVHNMEVSGQVLMNHVDSVLDIARFESGKMTAAREKINLSDLMQDIVDGQSGNAASKGNAIEWQWVGTPHPWVLTDAQRLRQILLNLVGNAIKFTDDGRISLEIERSDPAAPAEGAEYEFRVIDTGIGISEDDQDRVFEDFETTDATIGRNVGGTGLGLGIARRFVSTLGGEIGVESEPGEGCVFWVRLPLTETTPEMQEEPPAEMTAISERLDVLVVEDNEINSEVVRRILELDGHAVTLAENGKEGVDAAHGHQFDVILMDISMPVMDGPTATRHIRQGDGRSRETPIIAVSANVLPGAIDSFRKAGMNAFLGKPLTVETLRHALSTILSGPSDDPPPTSSSANPLDELRKQLGGEKLNALLRVCLAEGDTLATRLDDATEHNARDLAADCHKFAGSAGIFGLAELRSAVLACETALGAADDTAIAQANRAMQAEWQSTRPEIEAALEATPHPVDDQDQRHP